MQLLFGEHCFIEDGTYYCRLCQVRYDSFDAIESHCKEGSTHAWCDACELVFLDEDQLKEHWEDKEYHHFCPNCNNQFIDYTDEEELIDHRLDAHSWCPGCDLLLASEKAFESHIIYEHAACEVCLQIFDDMEQCHLHMKTHADDGYQCPRCDHTEKTFSAVLQHLELSSGCGGLEEVMRLVRETHGYKDFYIRSASGFSFYCKSCLRRWANLSQLALHLENMNECKWLVGPSEAFPYMRESLNRRRQQDSPPRD